jgi:hypothetical protein
VLYNLHTSEVIISDSLPSMPLLFIETLQKSCRIWGICRNLRAAIANLQREERARTQI